MLQINIGAIVVTETPLSGPARAIQSALNKQLKNMGASARVVSIQDKKVHLYFTTIVNKKFDIEDKYMLMYWVENIACKSVPVETVECCSCKKIEQPTTGLIQKYKDLLIPELEKQIVFNRLVFTHSQKFTNGKKSLYLNFAAYNNALDEWQSISYEPATGYLHVTLHHMFVKPQK